jgi:hypothetical protein
MYVAPGLYLPMTITSRRSSTCRYQLLPTRHFKAGSMVHVVLQNFTSFARNNRRSHKNSCTIAPLSYNAAQVTGRFARGGASPFGSWQMHRDSHVDVAHECVWRRGQLLLTPAAGGGSVSSSASRKLDPASALSASEILETIHGTRRREAATRSPRNSVPRRWYDKAGNNLWTV